LTRVSPTCARANRVATLAELRPEATSIDEDAALVDYTFEEQGRIGLDADQVRHVHSSTGHLPKAGLQARPGRVVGERYQQIQVGAGILVAARLRTVENRQSHPTLGTKRPSKIGEQPPVSAKVIALTRGQTQPARTGATGVDSALSHRPTQRSLVDIELVRQPLDRSHGSAS